MVTSLVPEQPGECILVDAGAFHLAEFAQTLGRPYEGSAVHGSIHVLQICSSQLVSRMLMFPRLPATCKVQIFYISASDLWGIVCSHCRLMHGQNRQHALWQDACWQPSVH